MNYCGQEYQRKRSQKRLNAIIKRLPRKPRILDVGCNTGYFTRGLAPFASEIVGIDCDSATIAEARKKYSAIVTYQVRDLSDLEGLGQFDVVLCLSVLHHVMASTKDYGDQKGDVSTILSKFCAIAPVLFLEIPDVSDKHWSRYMPCSPIKLLRDAGYGYVEYIEPPGFEGSDGGFQYFLHRYFFGVLSKHEKLRRWLGFNFQDARPMFYARR